MVGLSVESLYGRYLTQKDELIDESSGGKWDRKEE
jgi:hypothetical protein